MLTIERQIIWLVNRKAIDIIDRALPVPRGAGDLGKHPLSQLDRDVRADPFRQPLFSIRLSRISGR